MKQQLDGRLTEIYKGWNFSFKRDQVNHIKKQASLRKILKRTQGENKYHATTLRSQTNAQAVENVLDEVTYFRANIT